MRNIGKYTLVGPSADDDWTPEQIILDTNVLIDIRNFYFGEGRVPAELKDLLLEFPYTARRRFVEINYGWATIEASWVRGTGVDLVQRRRLVYAAEQVLWWDRKQIIKQFEEYRRPPVARDRKWGRVPLENEADQPDPRIMLISHYGSLLYLLSLEKQRARRKSKGPLWAIQQYITWVTDVFGVRDSYTLNLATMLLAGDGESQNAVRRILKFKDTATPEEMSRIAWNVAWDIAMTSLGEGITYGLLSGARKKKTVLVTYDADPTLLRLGTELKAVIDTGNGVMPFSRMRSSLKVSHTDLQKIIDLDPLDAWRRLSRDPATLMKQAARAVQDLESELGVPVSFYEEEELSLS
ncbi:hypothetical protein [Arthrobacter sp. GMC3]|uniref:hypothetical protein n=1 Tax=Arthrobacter sp. GMC3 TaxID=2058894 RepID=UPI000CE3B5D6|nr:hypothetical protein [Arthrobacter sp. GMC3]